MNYVNRRANWITRATMSMEKGLIEKIENILDERETYVLMKEHKTISAFLWRGSAM